MRTGKRDSKLFMVTVVATHPPTIEGVGLPFVSPSDPAPHTMFLSNKTSICGHDLLSFYQQNEFKLVMVWEGMMALANDQFRRAVPSPDMIPRSPFPYTNQ